MKIALLGFAREGQSVLRFLMRDPRYKNADISVLDKQAVKTPRGVRAQIGEKYLSSLRNFDLIFRTPGVPYNLPELQKARKGGVRFSSLTKLFFESAGKKTRHIIGVTGTKGKGTTSTLLYEILKASGKKVFLAGNIGSPVLDILPKLVKGSWVVVELSSFQLQDLTVSPPIAVVLEIFPDHQDAHKNLKEYYESKANIARYQKSGNMVFFFKDNHLSQWIGKKSKGTKIAVDPKHFALFEPNDLKLRGAHNFRNSALAATLAMRLGISPKTILKAIRGFRGVEHRLEFVRKIGGVSFYNDSASTNPHTSAAAVKAFPNEAKILIAGGQDKKLDYAPLAKALKAEDVKLVILFGENKEKIERAIKQGTRDKGHETSDKGQKTRIILVDNLKQAVGRAYAFALSHVASHPVTIIFSPGAASFDMFKNYADRGEKFKRIVNALTKK